MARVDPSAPVRVHLVCSGLDHAHRGFESFARECFAALRQDPRLDIRLIKGSGPAGEHERSVRSLTRESPLVRALARALGREPYHVEQAAFALSLQSQLLADPPDVVYFSEWHTGLVLAGLRRLTRRSHRLVLCNGGMVEHGFGFVDLVQQLTPVALGHVLSLGADPGRQRVLPLGFSIAPGRPPVSSEERRALRARLALPLDRPIVLSVAALNRHHKRIDYVIDEVARLPEPRPFLLLVGQAETETPELRSMADRLLGDGYAMRTVTLAEVDDLYRASDVFVLASLGESFGRVLVEAMAHGLRCIAHDYSIPRDVLAGHGLLTDLSRPGGLAAVLADPPADAETPAVRSRYAYERYSWDRLRDRYAELLIDAAALGRPQPL